MRIRSSNIFILAALLAACSPAPAQEAAAATAQPGPVADSATRAAPIVSLAVHALPDSIISLAKRPHSVPERSKVPAPLSLLAFAAAGTVKRRTSRRAKGVKIPDVPLFLDSDVHVMRDGELVVIRGSVLVDDTELDDDEIEDLIKRGVVRPATHSERASLDAADSLTARADLVREQEQEVAALSSAHETALAEADAAGSLTPAKRDSLVARQGKELTALREQHAAALNALAE